MPDPKVALAKDDETPPPIKLAADDELPPPKNTYSFDINKYGNKSKQVPIASLGIQGNIFPSTINNNEAQRFVGTSPTDREFQKEKLNYGSSITGRYIPIKEFKPFNLVGSVGEENVSDRTLDTSYNDPSNPRAYKTTPYQSKNELTTSLGAEFNLDNSKTKDMTSNTWDAKGTHIGGGIESLGNKIFPYGDARLQENANIINNKNNKLGVSMVPINLGWSPNSIQNTSDISAGLGLYGELKNIGLSGNIYGSYGISNNSPEIQFGLKKTFNTPKKYPKTYYGSGQNERYL